MYGKLLVIQLKGRNGEWANHFFSFSGTNMIRFSPAADPLLQAICTHIHKTRKKVLSKCSKLFGTSKT